MKLWDDHLTKVSNLLKFSILCLYHTRCGLHIMSMWRLTHKYTLRDVLGLRSGFLMQNLHVIGSVWQAHCSVHFIIFLFQSLSQFVESQYWYFCWRDSSNNWPYHNNWPRSLFWENGCESFVPPPQSCSSRVSLLFMLPGTVSLLFIQSC